MKEESDNICCPHCLELNNPNSPNCVKCGGPLLAISTIGPFERIETHGFAQREAINRPKRLIVVIGVWLLWFPALLACIIPVFLDPNAAFVLLPMSILPIIIIFKTTRNYVKYRKEITLNKHLEYISKGSDTSL